MAQPHPTRDQLAAFVHGRLSEAESRAMETHVSQCETCCDELRQVPHDDLVERLRGSTFLDPAPAAVDSAASSISPLANHPRYQIVRELGQGGMGVVYLAEHRVMGRLVALKVINRRLLRNQMAVERFRKEVQAAARLNHRNIVTAFDAEQAGDLHFLVMEYVEGMDLATTVSRHGPLPVLYACNYVNQAAQGLQHAHEQGMVHRDIKPQNLMRTRKGTIKILDFGLARLATPSESEVDPSGLTVEGVTLGTPDYIAPEQGRDARRADIRSDIYSLGCTLYFLLVAKVPYPTGTAVEKIIAHGTDAPPSLKELRSDLPDDLVKIVERMMAKDPAARYQTPAEVARALKPFSHQNSMANQPAATFIDKATPVQLSETRVDAPAADVNEDQFTFLDPAPTPDAVKPRQMTATLRTLKKSHLMIAGSVFALVLVTFSAWQLTHRPENLPSSTSNTKAGQNPTRTNAPSSPVQTAASSEWIDLIVRVDPVKDSVFGTWSRRGGELVVDAAEATRLTLPYTAPAEYDMEVEFTRQSGRNSIALIFPAGTGQGTFEVDAWSEHLAGIQVIDGQDLRAQSVKVQRSLNNRQRYTMRLEVRRDHVSAFLDQKLVTTYHGSGSDLHPLELWRLPAGDALGIGAFNAETTFHAIRIRPH